MAQRDGDDVIGYDDNESTAASVADEFGLDRVGSTPAFINDVLSAVDEVIVSPGFPLAHWLRTAARARGVAFVGDVGLTSRPTDAPNLAVHGTNGMSPVTRLITEMLTAAGHPHTTGANS